MDPQVLKAAGQMLAIIVACPVIYMCMKAAAFFGSMKTTVEGLGTSVGALQLTLQQFTKEVTENLTDHGGRILVNESRVDALERAVGGERRASAPTGEPYDRRAS